MKQQFYTLGATFKSKWYWGRVLTPLDMERIAAKSMRDFKDTVEIEISEGKQAGDFLWNGMPLLVVSSKVIEIWSKYKSFETYNIRITNAKLDLEYKGVSFTGRGGPYDPAKSKAVYKQVHEDRKPIIIRQDGLYFDDSFWDGSDLLAVDEFPCIGILTRRVVDEMEKNKITNCIYKPIEEYGKIKVPKFD